MRYYRAMNDERTECEFTLRLTKSDRAKLDHVCKLSGMNLQQAIRAMIRASYGKANGRRKRQLDEPL